MIECPKCEHEHEPTGSYDDDKGEFTCEECDFEFIVEVEYDPSYSSSCKTHSFGPFKVMPAIHLLRPELTAKFCEYCGACEIKKEVF